MLHVWKLEEPCRKGVASFNMIEVTTRELGEMPPSTVATQIEGIVLHTCQVTAGK